MMGYEKMTRFLMGYENFYCILKTENPLNSKLQIAEFLSNRISKHCNVSLMFIIGHYHIYSHKNLSKAFYHIHIKRHSADSTI